MMVAITQFDRTIIELFHQLCLLSPLYRFYQLYLSMHLFHHPAGVQFVKLSLNLFYLHIKILPYFMHPEDFKTGALISMKFSGNYQINPEGKPVTFHSDRLSEEQINIYQFNVNKVASTASSASTKSSIGKDNDLTLIDCIAFT